jgi:glycerophosphoryl diester phosphodiesterase
MFFKVGHRGARAYEVENTINSFERAIELGVNAVEFDVRITKDGKPIVFHDDNMKRVFGKDVPVVKTTLKELRELSENRIPTLEEALIFIGNKVEKILIELKEKGIERKVLSIVKKSRLRDRIIIISFHEDVLSEIRKLDKNIETGLVYARHKNPVASALKLNAGYLLPLYRFVHTKDVTDAHKNNLSVIVWTINTREEAKEYKAKGVDGIASDKPDIL